MRDNLKEFFDSKNEAVIFGAGIQSKRLYCFCHYAGKKIFSFLTSKDEGVNFRYEYLIYHLDSFPKCVDKNSCDVVVAINEKHNEEVIRTLQKAGFQNIFYSYDWQESNERYKHLYVEDYLLRHGAVVSDGLISYKNDKKDFKIAYSDDLPAEYSAMLLGTFQDLVMPSIFGDYSILEEGPYEYGKVKIDEGDIVFDLGANIGVFSAVAAS